MIQAFAPFLVGISLLTSLGFVTSHDARSFGDIGIGTANPWVSTTSPAAVTQKVYGRAIKITGLSDGCLELSSSLVISSGSTCGSGSGGFSTTSADYWKDQRNFFSTTSAQYFVHSSTTIPKTYTANTFTGAQTFNALTTLANASSTLFSTGYASSTLYYGAGLADCNTGNMLTWTSGRFGCEDDTSGSGGTGLATSTAIADTYMIYGTAAGTVGATANLTYDDAALLFKHSSAAAAPYLRLQGVNDGDNFGALELWNGDASKKWQFAHSNTGNFTFNHFNGGWTAPLTIEDDNDILVGSNSLNFNAGGTTGSNYKFAQDGDDLLTIQRSGGTDTNYSLLQLKAPSANPTEATLALMTDGGGGNYRFMDVYNQQYRSGGSPEVQWGLRQRYAGTYEATPFVIDYFNGTTKFPQMVILPGGNIGFGIATSSVNTATLLHIASSSATNLLKVDAAAGVNKLLVTASSIVGEVLATFNAGITAIGTVDFSGATVKQHTYPKLTWPGTATTTTATTTVPVGQAMTAESWSYTTCRVTSGSSGYRFGDGSNWFTYRGASTTASRFAATSNNTFTADENQVIEIGPLTAAQFTCGLDVIVNN